jgi:N6-adenosine-specific RNA methylase IME4
MRQRSLLASRVPAPPRAGAYTVLYMDHPWPEYGGGQIQRGADRHYPLMSIAEILALPFGEWAAKDAHLYAWATNNYLEAAFKVIRAYGFRYVTTVTWVKDRMGIGQYYRGRTEHCLFAVRGRLPYRIRDDGKRAQGQTVIYAPDPSESLPDPADLPSAFEAPVTKHSKKPEQMRRYIELVSGGHGPMLECFAREAAPGFDVWGNQAPEVTT